MITTMHRSSLTHLHAPKTQQLLSRTSSYRSCMHAPDARRTRLTNHAISIRSVAIRAQIRVQAYVIVVLSANQDAVAPETQDARFMIFFCARVWYSLALGNTLDFTYACSKAHFDTNRPP
ncbi:hypothetical protein HBI53_094290 [Parastagonospora nodorum]|nr:hypothetical protein HBI53_094290 [Parastagonospora nodorum]